VILLPFPKTDRSSRLSDDRCRDSPARREPSVSLRRGPAGREAEEECWTPTGERSRYEDPPDRVAGTIRGDSHDG
jgi:hypothetical protein